MTGVATATQHLRPLAIGEIIDRSASFWRKHWLPLFRLNLGFQLAGFAMLKAWELGIRQIAPAAVSSKQMTVLMQSQPEEAFRQLGISLGAGGGTGLVFVAVSFIAGVAASRYIWPAWLGQPVTVGESFARTLKSLPRTLSILLLTLLAPLLVLAVALAPSGALAIGAYQTLDTSPAATVVLALLAALLSGVALVGVVLWWILRFAVVHQVIALEDKGVWETFKRSGDLASGRIGKGFFSLVKWRLMVLITVGAAIIGAVSTLSSLPATLVQLIYGNALDPMNATPENVPQGLLIPLQLISVVAGAVVAPLSTVFTCVFYGDMRVRREGLDLELKMSELP